MHLDKKGRSTYERLGAARLQSRDISELIGLCKGVLADGVVNLQEAMFILQWLESHRTVVDTWPANILYETLDKVLEDGKLSSQEECELLGVLTEITGVPVTIELSVVSNSGKIIESVTRTLQTSTTLPLNEPGNGITFEGHNFVMTGNFRFGSRRDCEAAVIAQGGQTQKGVTRATNYLIIGEIGSECWAQSSFGRKIEQAVYMRDSGQNIYIVSEAVWADQIPK